ncbi:VRR-NUC domain-containing protein [Xylaria digitata]|nr:VRR-NUC domain-containing protein [Xylaria digitata]
MDAFLKKANPNNCSASQKIPSLKQKPARLEEHPKKKAKREKAHRSDTDSDEYQIDTPPLNSWPDLRRDVSAPDSPADDDVTETSEAEDARTSRPTAIESSLPDIRLDQKTIEEYQNFRASQGNDAGSTSSRLDSRAWVRGKSSLYVDAFNLALDTVLEEEAYLFDKKERRVFQEWCSLNYEAQFLYVRLFLRKRSSWHRVARLGYYDDITDTEAAVKELQRNRELPRETSPEQSPPILVQSETSIFIQEQCVFDGTFSFADSSEDFIDSIEEAISLLSLDEVKKLAKEAKVQGKNKSDLARAICRMSSQQAGLLSMSLRRADTAESVESPEQKTPVEQSPDPASGDAGNRRKHFLDKILAITGPCVRLSLSVFKLFERVHLVFYRSTEWTEKSLTTIILAKASKRNFPSYIVSRSSSIFASRSQLLEFETAMRSEYAVDNILEFNGPVTEAGFQKVVDAFEMIYPRWKAILQEEQKKEQVYESSEGAYLRRLSPGYTYTHIVHKAAYALGRLKQHRQEHTILTELLSQRLFHLARRGSWYQRKALLEEHYMHALLPNPAYTDLERQKNHWKAIAVATCERALEDPDCHLKYHYDLQKRLVKLEKQLKTPLRLQHDFGHVKLKKPEEHYVEGIQLKKLDNTTGRNGRGPSTKTIWVDEAEVGGECSVESMCLNWYRCQGWKGYHAEGGIIRTLFAYLFFDILFLYIPNVFQTAYQTCPLDLHTDAFYPTRASEINHRLVEIANGEAPRLIDEVDKREREKRTCVVGLNWDYERDDLLELADCFDGASLATVCKVIAQEYGQRGGGIPDLILWRAEPQKECMFAEVKSANDRLSDTQRLWIHVLTGAGLRVVLCNAVAKEVKEI